MKALVLVDTSVWIAFFRPAVQPWKAKLVELLRASRVAIVAPVVAELLYGARGNNEHARVLDLSQAATMLPSGIDQWIQAGELGRALRSKGLTLSIVDCLIAAAARQESVPVWTLDADFEPLFAEGAVKRFSASL